MALLGCSSATPGCTGSGLESLPLSFLARAGVELGASSRIGYLLLDRLYKRQVCSHHATGLDKSGHGCLHHTMRLERVDMVVSPTLHGVGTILGLTRVATSTLAPTILLGLTDLGKYPLIVIIGKTPLSSVAIASSFSSVARICSS